MEQSTLVLPKDYKSVLNLNETQRAIKVAKDNFEKALSKELHLMRVSAPLFVFPSSGLNDNLSGVERPVEFDIKNIVEEVQVVQSLAKWKRMALHRYDFEPGYGLYTDMNAIRRDEVLDNTHSVYVDQWDWEKIITQKDRTMDYLKDTVRHIVRAMEITQYILRQDFPQLKEIVNGDVFFITTSELEEMYPDKNPEEREQLITEKHRTVFVTQIGRKLNSGEPHGSRSPDYDDWDLNGDLLVWHEPLGIALELSSMGVRVNPEVLSCQLEISGCNDRRDLFYHKMLLEDKLPLTIGGGVGQSRLCMFLLHKAHIGEVQASIWSDDMIKTCEDNGIILL